MSADRKLVRLVTRCPVCKGLAEVIGKSNGMQLFNCKKDGNVGRMRRDIPHEVRL